jgi:pyruvate/2-oxoglutarate dehydrogenase complex dihydrolipoamide acyltransferase (E2) component
MAHVVVMPRSDVMTTENRFVQWLKEVGEEVEIGEPLFQIETEKAVMDMESLYEGVLLERIALPDQIFQIGAPLGIIGEPGEEYDRKALVGDVSG